MNRMRYKWKGLSTMKYVLLKHKNGLGYPRVEKLPFVSCDFLKEWREGADYLITFQPIKGRVPDLIIKDVNACTRFINRFSGHVVAYRLEENSEFASGILWDIAHTLSVKDLVTCIGAADTYQREYFQGYMRVIESDGEKKTFQKDKPLLVETEKGLEDWTFGVPAGPGDATFLNAVVKRILEIPCRNKEILLCGRPGKNFKYFDKVRIIGENITAPPVQICKKKNLIAKEAKHDNLCILHARVFLPANFMEAMKKYGDYFGFLGFQSMYFKDSWNRCLFRYSDFGKIRFLQEKSYAIVNDNREVSAFTHESCPVVDGTHWLFCGNPLKFGGNRYLTGSLYICKKSLWNFCPQDGALVWEDYEDVEHSLRAMEKGIDIAINPFAVTQSLYGRKGILGAGGNHSQSKNGKIKIYYNLFHLFCGKGKPALSITEDVFRRNIRQFCALYKIQAGEIEGLSGAIDGALRLKIILTCVLKSDLPADYDSIHEYVKNIDKLLLNGGLTKADIEFFTREFFEYRAGAKYSFVHWPRLTTIYLLEKGPKVFCGNATEYFVKPSVFCRLGSFLTACYLWRNNGELFYHPEGLKGFYRAIMDSTPWKSYVED